VGTSKKRHEYIAKGKLDTEYEVGTATIKSGKTREGKQKAAAKGGRAGGTTTNREKRNRNQWARGKEQERKRDKGQKRESVNRCNGK
jgi:hypothetical protein